MRFLAPILLFITLALAWSHEDNEIFRLRAEVQDLYGENATFYSILSLPKSATSDAIARAYRKAGLTQHPDKARAAYLARTTPRPSQKQVKAFHNKASEKWARLGLVAEVLRSERRARYDHYLDNGFPAWRGTGWYYARFRPGLGSVMVGLWVALAGGAHYLALWTGWRKRREFVVKLISQARQKALGEDSRMAAIPGLGREESDEEPVAQQWNRREKRAAMKEKKRKPAAKKARESGISTPVEASVYSGPVGAKKRTVAENGKVLIVDSAANVWLEEETEDGQVQEFLLDPDEVAAPTIHDTALVQLPLWVWRTGKARITGDRSDIPDDDELPEEEEALKAATAPNRNAEMRRRKTKIHPKKGTGLVGQRV